MESGNNDIRDTVMEQFHESGLYATVVVPLSLEDEEKVWKRVMKDGSRWTRVHESPKRRGDCMRSRAVQLLLAFLKCRRARESVSLSGQQRATVRIVQHSLLERRTTLLTPVREKVL